MSLHSFTTCLGGGKGSTLVTIFLALLLSCHHRVLRLHNERRNISSLPPTFSSAKAMAEDNPVETPKRKRGRPPKPDSEKATPKRKAESDSASPAKRGRGRPKGSKNKGSVAAKKPASKGTGKRGRPPKNPPKEDASEESAEDAE